jgi:hypothetical protein
MGSWAEQWNKEVYPFWNHPALTDAARLEPGATEQDKHDAPVDNDGVELSGL